MKVHNVGTKMINVWAYQNKDAYVLVDSGYQKDSKQLVSNLNSLGILVENINAVFITHMHAERVGGLKTLLSINPEIRLILRKDTLARMYWGFNVDRSLATSKKAARNLSHIPDDFRKFDPIGREFEKNCVYIDEIYGEELDRLLIGQIFSTPGHTRDHVSLMMPDGTCFCGDVACNGSRYKDYAPWTVEDARSLRWTWEYVKSFEDVTLYPGCGEPFSNKVLNPDNISTI